MRETVAMRKIISTLPNAAKFTCNEHQVTHICTHAVIPNRTVNTMSTCMCASYTQQKENINKMCDH